MKRQGLISIARRLCAAFFTAVFLPGVCVLSAVGLSPGRAFASGAVLTLGTTAKTVRTITVAPVGSLTENGTALRTALAGITGADSENPYLIKLEPGNYYIGIDALAMVPYVDIEGSGVDTTTIIGAVFGPNPDTGLIVGADNAELRGVTLVVETDVPVDDNEFIGIYNDGVSPTINDVVIEMPGQAALNYGRGIYNNNNAAPVLRRVRINVSQFKHATGIVNYSSNPTVYDSEITVKDASVSNTGIQMTSESGLWLWGTSVSVSGAGAVGLSAPSEQLADVSYINIVDSDLSATGGTVIYVYDDYFARIFLSRLSGMQLVVTSYLGRACTCAFSTGNLTSLQADCTLPP